MPETTATIMTTDQNKQAFLSLCKQFIETGDEAILTSITSDESLKTLISALDVNFFWEIFSQEFIDSIQTNIDPIASLQSLFNYLFPLIKEKIPFFLPRFDRNNDTLLHVVLRLNSARFTHTYLQALSMFFLNENEEYAYNSIVRAHFMQCNKMMSATNSAFFAAILTKNSEIVQVFLAQLKRIMLYQEDFYQRTKQGENLLMVIAQVGDVKILTAVSAFMSGVFGEHQARLILKKLSLDPYIIPSANRVINQQIEQFRLYQAISSASTMTEFNHELYGFNLDDHADEIPDAQVNDGMGGYNSDEGNHDMLLAEEYVVLEVRKQQAEDGIELIKEEIDAWIKNPTDLGDITSSMKQIKGFYSFLYEADAAKRYQREVLNKFLAGIKFAELAKDPDASSKFLAYIRQVNDYVGVELAKVILTLTRKNNKTLLHYYADECHMYSNYVSTSQVGFNKIKKSMDAYLGLAKKTLTEEEFQAYVDQTDTDQKTALHRVCFKNSKKAALLLIDKYQARTDIKDMYGCTADSLLKKSKIKLADNRYKLNFAESPSGKASDTSAVTLDVEHCDSEYEFSDRSDSDFSENSASEDETETQRCYNTRHRAKEAPAAKRGRRK